MLRKRGNVLILCVREYLMILSLIVYVPFQKHGIILSHEACSSSQTAKLLGAAICHTTLNQFIHLP